MPLTAPHTPGSSPRMRGAQPSGRVLMQGSGIIPADAGSTGNSIDKASTRGDHPRGCGEHT